MPGCCHGDKLMSLILWRPTAWIRPSVPHAHTHNNNENAKLRGTGRLAGKKRKWIRDWGEFAWRGRCIWRDRKRVRWDWVPIWKLGMAERLKKAPKYSVQRRMTKTGSFKAAFLKALKYCTIPTVSQIIDGTDVYRNWNIFMELR